MSQYSISPICPAPTRYTGYFSSPPKYDQQCCSKLNDATIDGTDGSNDGPTLNTIQQHFQDSSASPISSPHYRCRTSFNFYYWLHVVCARPSAECCNKKPGHKNSATFDNKFGDFMAFCTGTQPNWSFGPVKTLNNYLNLNKLFNLYQSTCAAPSTSLITLKGNSGATSHYIAPKDKVQLTNLRYLSPTDVTLSNADLLLSTQTGDLNIPHVSTAAKTMSMFYLVCKINPNFCWDN